MKILKTEIAIKLNSLFTVVERNESFFSSPLHTHPEYELVFIKESFGKRIVGNLIESFEPGDMVLIGPNLPHIWMNDESYLHGENAGRAIAIVVYFHPSLFDAGLFSLEEASHIKELLHKSQSGIFIQHRTRAMIATKMENLLALKGFEKVLGLLEILHLLSSSTDLASINSGNLSTAESKSEKDRLCEVYRFVHENFRNDIQLKDVAQLTNLTPQSFCRLFKKRNNIHFVEYLNQVRISNACKLLLDSDWTVSEIAYNCGYKTISNFNKLFKETTGHSPKNYREQATHKIDLLVTEN
ncbi:AraC family transcriptional regulator [Flavihumibacter profundi]|uniref:AraC family transcriptional regulator n=1 Tax=Flavihumibacter profundi TaxID=2716883 RepID=UPI001CC4DFC1|nr:AraC family transcriptional regulator [Flavihumibacter profundi]MBZ5856316.1 AraC family transcriptional regulator [Flavihumibacter profundi]